MALKVPVQPKTFNVSMIGSGPTHPQVLLVLSFTQTPCCNVFSLTSGFGRPVIWPCLYRTFHQNTAAPLLSPQYRYCITFPRHTHFKIPCHVAVRRRGKYRLLC